MTWQEELRELDSALAGGDLSASDYRRRRDEILAAASSAQPNSPIIGPPTGPRPAVDPTALTDVPPPASGEPDDVGEITQVVTASSTSPPPAPQAVEEPDPETTQVVGKSERQAQALAEANHAAPPPPAWAARRPEPGAPTGTFPQPPMPMAPPVGAINPFEAQDLFTSNRPSRDGNKAKPALIALAIIVVLAVAGGAVWYFGFDKTPAASDPSGTEGSDPSPPPKVDIADVALPGKKVRNTGELDMADARAKQVLSATEATLLAEAGIDEVTYTGAAEGDYRYLLYSYPAEDAAAAVANTGAVDDIQEQVGLRQGEAEGVPDGVLVSTITNDRAAALRGLYTHGDTTIQLCVLQVPTGDPGELRQQFDKVLAVVVDAAPPTS